MDFIPGFYQFTGKQIVLYKNVGNNSFEEHNVGTIQPAYTIANGDLDKDGRVSNQQCWSGLVHHHAG